MTGRASSLHPGPLTARGHVAKLCLMEVKGLISLCANTADMCYPFQSLVMVMPRYLIFSTLSKTVPSKV